VNTPDSFLMSPVVLVSVKFVSLADAPHTEVFAAAPAVIENVPKSGKSIALEDTVINNINN
jgi:hypothetical protein